MEDECFDFFGACGEAGSGDGELDAGGLAFFSFLLAGEGSGDEERDAGAGPFGRLLLLLRRRRRSWGLEVFGFAVQGDSVHVIVVVRWRCFSAREGSGRLGLRLVGVSPGRAWAQIARPRMIGQRVCPPRA